jgi:HEAT repeat protein
VQKRLTHAQLAKMSGRSGQQLAEFMADWSAMPLTERRRVARALVQLAEENVELDYNDLFLRLLEDADPQVRTHAIEGLWEDERPSTADALIGVARSDDEAVRATALKALGRFAYRIALGELNAPVAARVREAIIESAAPPMPLAVRRRAVEAVGYVPDDEAVPGIIREAYRSENPGLRASAVRAMGFTCDVTWLNTVLREMESEDPEMRFEAAQAAGQIEDERAVPLLVRAARDHDHEVRLAAVAALGAIGGQAAREALLGLLRSGDDVLREAADAALEELNVATDPLGVRVRDVHPN